MNDECRGLVNDALYKKLYLDETALKVTAFNRRLTRSPLSPGQTGAPAAEPRPVRWRFETLSLAVAVGTVAIEPARS
ncbi:MAG TPA: hypothetical protein VG502_07660 [Flexivirga sp.]|uniref:hypothetical protein n=1 Tax=Flexivirga sp. TaxID=1962927 RepID=UPI002C20E4FD|nr:hypothetical protein [Flexivirga sp.]HWC22157.1 hypothetical protein [Flexivirga sp.]